jgi:hypothetical protein
MFMAVSFVAAGYLAAIQPQIMMMVFNIWRFIAIFQVSVLMIAIVARYQSGHDCREFQNKGANFVICLPHSLSWRDKKEAKPFALTQVFC